jgi:serine/threonine protein phosphatase PrpC
VATSQIEETQWFRPIESNLDELEAKYFGDAAAKVQVEFGGLTHQGLRRSNNEDHYSIVRRFRGREVVLTNLPEAQVGSLDEAYAFAVADGVGGAAFGELASMLALRTGWELTGKAFKWNFNPSQAELEEMEEAANVYMQLIHRRIQKEAESKGRYDGMGTTLTCALTMGLNAFIVHVGDSRAYLYRDERLYCLTKDQTLAESMVAAGIISSVDEAAKQFRNTLVSCLGANMNSIDVATKHVKLRHQDRLMLCTDGLTDMVSESNIASILASAETPQHQCQELINAALSGGGRDNVTVIVGAYSECSERPTGCIDTVQG